MSIKNIFFLLLILLSLIFSLTISRRKNKNVDRGNQTYAFKFMDINTYPYSISESLFWENSDVELARISLNSHDFGEALINDVRKLKKIDHGLKSDFDYAFIIGNFCQRDTLYASLSRNLWTIKEDGKYYFYNDANGELSDILINYSSFFSDCW